MPQPSIEPILGQQAGGGDGAGLLALNNAHAAELSWLEPWRFAQLLGRAFAALRIGADGALLLAFDQDADYDSVNFRWFRGRMAKFVYLDRIVVAPAARGQGWARLLYAELFRQAGQTPVVCEVNSDPPNPASDKLHASLGFVTVGSARLARKTVRYLSRAPGA